MFPVYQPLPDALQTRTRNAYLYPDTQYLERRKVKNQLRVENMIEQRSKRYQGVLTEGSRKRLEKACTILSEMTPKRRVYNPIIRKTVYFKLAMITLTISQVSDIWTPKKASRHLLKPFLQWLGRTRGAKGYVWKAERQANGQVHYHILTDVFIPHSEVRNKWNYLQAKHGLLQDFEEKQGHSDANSTDIHQIRNVSNITNYFITYLKGKKHDDSPTEGKVWDCSYNLKKAKYHTCEPDPITLRNIEKGVAKGEIQVHQEDYVTCFRFVKKAAKYYLSANQFLDYQRHYREIRAMSLEPPVKKRKKREKQIVLKGLLN